jgi:hypothetical protein
MLTPLNEQETREYIRHRLEVAGGNIDLFEDDTYRVIWQGTQGSPRLINILCGMALVYGFADQKTSIDVTTIEQVIQDKRITTEQTSSSSSSMESEPGAIKTKNVPEAQTNRDFVDKESKDVTKSIGSEAKPKSRPKRTGPSSIEKLFK